MSELQSLLTIEFSTHVTLAASTTSYCSHLIAITRLMSLFRYNSHWLLITTFTLWHMSHFCSTVTFVNSINLWPLKAITLPCNSTVLCYIVYSAVMVLRGRGESNFYFFLHMCVYHYFTRCISQTVWLNLVYMWSVDTWFDLCVIFGCFTYSHVSTSTNTSLVGNPSYKRFCDFNKSYIWF